MTIKTAFKKTVQEFLGQFNLRFVNRAYLEQLIKTQISDKDLGRLALFTSGHLSELVRSLPDSKAEFRQDLFVLSQLGCKRNGYFVDFGATDGIGGSNTCLLERSFGWTGILAEPARSWHAALARNRTSLIDTRCVWNASGETLSFNEVVGLAELSTIKSYSGSDMWGERRANGTTYDVETVSLNDLLATHGAPGHMDYLSIDTEGSEFEILRQLDFDRYRFSVITCEHNFTPMRQELHVLLTSKGYVRTLESISAVDDWYVDGALLRQADSVAST